MNWLNNITWKNRYTRLTQWEYWPIFTFYGPLFFYYIFLAIRARHPFFMTATNPGIFTGGTGMESKYKTIMMLPEALRPKTILAEVDEDFDHIRNKMDEEGLSYPVIAKPDIGYRGLLVKKIKNDTDLKAYLERFPLDFLIQEYIALSREAGVHFHRFPGQEKGKITSVTLKKYLSVTGDGSSTVMELVKNSDRALLQIDRLLASYETLLDTVPAMGEGVPLGTIGNHSKGTTFINGNDMIDEEMEATYGKIVDQLNGIHFCRFDLKCEAFEDLKTGHGIKVIEINGIGAEPTHIYDPNHISFWGAIRTIGRHWTIIWKLARINHHRGVPYFGIRKMIKTLLEHRSYIKNINRINDLLTQGGTT